MLNIFHILRNQACSLYKHDSKTTYYEQYLAKRFYVKNGELSALHQKTHNLFTKTFPFYTALKQALDTFGLDYEISLAYHYKTGEYKQNEYYPPYNKACYTYIKGQDLVEFTPELNIKLHFPRVDIVNRDRNTHIVKDLFVKFSIDIYHKINMLKGTRATVHPLEYFYRYKHSHLSACHGYAFTSFCLGSDAPISFTKIMLEEQLTESNTNWADTFLFFLNQIKAYVSYESLEGGPYIKMSALVPRNITLINSIGFFQLFKAYSSLMRSFNAYANSSIFDFIKNNNLTYTNQNIGIKKQVFNNVFFSKDFLNSIHIEDNIKANYFTYTYNNLPIDYNTVSNQTEQILNDYVFFQGKKIHVVVKPETNFDNPDDIKVDVKKILKDYVYNKFVSKINP